MKATKVAELMTEYLGQKDLLKTTTLGGEETPTAEQQERLDVYLNCINDVVQSLGISYFPLKAITTLTSEDKKFSYTKFDKTLLQITKVVDVESGTKLRFKSFPEYFTAESAKALVSYCYQPAFASSFDDELDVVTNVVTPRLVALGAVSRYYLFEGMYTDSTAWSNMFERAILVASRPKRNLCIDKRSWF